MSHNVRYNDDIGGHTECPMCGAQVDQHGDCMQETGAHGDLHEVVCGMMRLFLHHRPMMTAVAVKLEHPEYSVRQISAATGYSKSMINYYLRDAARILPQLRTLLGSTTPGSIAQCHRRRGERSARQVLPAQDMEYARRLYEGNLKQLEKKEG